MGEIYVVFMDGIILVEFYQMICINNYVNNYRNKIKKI